MKTIPEINDRILKLMADNPQMGKWPKYKKRYLSLLKKHGKDYCFKTAKNKQDKEFLEWFEPLKLVREEIRELKSKKEILKTQKKNYPTGFFMAERKSANFLRR